MAKRSVRKPASKPVRKPVGKPVGEPAASSLAALTKAMLDEAVAAQPHTPRREWEGDALCRGCDPVFWFGPDVPGTAAERRPRAARSCSPRRRGVDGGVTADAPAEPGLEVPAFDDLEEMLAAGLHEAPTDIVDAHPREPQVDQPETDEPAPEQQREASAHARADEPAPHQPQQRRRRERRRGGSSCVPFVTAKPKLDPPVAAAAGVAVKSATRRLWTAITRVMQHTVRHTRNLTRRIARRGVILAAAVSLLAAACNGVTADASRQATPATRPAAAPAQASAVVAAEPVAVRVSLPAAVEGAVDADGNRLLAGADRYATAVLLASVPLDAGDARTDDLIVVSGESLVDAVSAVSVAAARDAAVVLTQTGTLPAVVSDFIAGRGFAHTTIGGGTNAVNEAAERQLARLVPTRDTSTARVDGETRYETAVNAARAAGYPGRWCDGQTAALLVSGESLVDGVIAAPVAYAMGLPLLFTQPDALPEVVSDYLAETGITRAVVVGSTSDVSGAVLAQLGATGVSTVAFDAAAAAARSVELADAMENCGTQRVAPGQYALLDAQQPVDGVAAAAALASGLGAHADADALIPILAVNQNSLPRPVADYLADAGQRHQTITLYPLGGVARLTPRVIERAVVAAGGEPATTAEDDADDGAGDSPRGSADRRPAGSRTPGVRNPGNAVAPPAGGASGTADSSTAGGAAGGAAGGVAGGAAGVPEFAATEDLDGDGELSFDELYPADTPHRDAYLAVSGGVAPPGAFAPPVDDLAEVAGDPRRSELSLGRTSHDRFPNGFPLPPGAPDYATTTFEERQQLRANAYATYAAPDPSSGAPRNTARGQWNDMYNLACENEMYSRELNHGRSQLGFATYPCEWQADWSIWQCDVLNDPTVTRLAPHEQWIELTVRYYDLWVDSMGRDRFAVAVKEVATVPAGWLLWDTQYRFKGYWEGVTYIGLPYCSFRLDSQPSKANQTFHNQQVTLLHDYFNARNGSTRSTSTVANKYIFEHVWLPRNRWYLDDVCPVDSTRCPSAARSG